MAPPVVRRMGVGARHNKNRFQVEPLLSPAVDVTLDAKVAFLRQPTSYPHPVYRVEEIETHMSWVFLTDGDAYKLKKPVCHEFLDFRTIEARRFYCEEEVRLNRRLAPDIYLGTVALALDAPGHFQLNGNGIIIDWLIKMRRLPMEQMLDYAIQHGTAQKKDMRRIAARLAEFYRTCAPVDITPVAYRTRIGQNIERNFQELSLKEYLLPIRQIHGICEAQRIFLQNQADQFNERVAAGKIVEGHGDLRPEHICITPYPTIIDCLEFSRELRIIDAVDEVAFLALECERLGAIELGKHLVRAYTHIADDILSPALIHFYQSYRASSRAVIAIRHLNEEKFRYSPQWPLRARAYLQLAEQHLARCRTTS